MDDRRRKLAVRLMCRALIVCVLALTAACASRPATPPPGAAQPDRFLFDRGNEAIKEEEWLNARTYFQQIVDNYPQSPVRPDAKLGMGDSYLGQGNTESLVLAANEFREFLTFYPTHPRADYAQYKMAMSHFEQMRAAGRDQTETAAALKDFDVFFQRYPNSPLMPEVKMNWRIARDRLSESSFLVGMTYYRQRWDPGAIERFREVLRDDPGYSARDRVYFHLAEALNRSGKPAEALPYYQRLLDEFKESEFLEDATDRLQALKTQ
ncbi:MAG: outer membrane protein assembly factor BamD [Acidimicrobiia bacterium]|nr:outer membrane protein assembly factor BamD [Acidimicrobiia bacterium]